MMFIEGVENIFGTRVYQKIGVDDIKEGYLLDEGIKLMREFEEKMSFFNKESEISKINKNAGKKFIKVSYETFEVIKKAKYYSKKTDGLFDITIAPLVKEWGINTCNPKFIENEKLDTLLSLVNYEDILLNEDNKEIMLRHSKQKIDLGGIAKGYIADKIVEFYKLNNIKSAIVNIGGNVKVLGKKDKENMWQIGISKPEKHSKETICSLRLEDTSVVTSGGYERAFIYEGKTYHHILNPKTGVPAKTDLKSITIVNENSVVADAYSTPLFIMGKYKATDFMIENNISGILVTEEDEIIVSQDLINKFALNKDCNVYIF